MDDKSRVVVSTLAGAVIGGLLGYLYLTAGGRRLREEIGPRLDEVSQELRKLRSTIIKAQAVATEAQAVATEGWQTLNEMIGEHERPRNALLRGEARQSSPF